MEIIILVIVVVAFVYFFDFILGIHNNKVAEKKMRNHANSLGEGFKKVSISNRLAYFENTDKQALSICLSNINTNEINGETPFVIDNIEKTRTSFVAFDNHNQKLLCAADINPLTHKHLGCAVVKYRDILSVQLIEDGNTVYSKSSARAIGGAVIGGAIMGGAGAIVGGLSGNTTQTTKVKSLAIKLILRNVNTPSVLLTLFMFGKEFDKSKLSDYYKAANRTIDRIKVIMDSIDNENVQTSAPSTTPAPMLSDSITKYAELLEKGLITEDEFKALKDKILNI